MKRTSNTQITGRSRSSKRAKLEPEPEFKKLNQSDPVHARRIQQRRRQVQMGKNTVGYDEYLRKVPRHKRRPRNMQYPTTPDHTLDIPTKRWQGLVKAWRKALHTYDPPDLLKAFDEADKEDKSNSTPPSTVQDKELAEASKKGLLVVISPENTQDATEISAQVSPAALFSDQVDKELDEWEKEGGGCDDDDFLLDDDDSDDDLI